MEDNTAFDIDPELLAGFVDEAQEGLATLDSLFVELEAEPSNLDIISAIFRPVHTVKGNSAFFGLMKVKKLAHELETLLDMAKQERLVPNQAIVDVLLEGVDQLKEMLNRTHEGQSEVEDEAYFNELLERVIAARETKQDAEILWTELVGKLEAVKTDFADLDSSYIKKLDDIIVVVSQLKADKFLGGDHTENDENQADSNIPEPLQEIKNILDRSSEEGLNETDAAVVLVNLKTLKEHTTNQQASEIIKNALDEYNKITGSGDTESSLLVELLQEKVEALMSLKDWTKASEPVKTKPVKPKADSTEQQVKPTEEARKTMRVTEDSIDNFLNYVGELIAVGEMYSHLQKMISESDLDTNLATDFRRVNETFSDLSDNLQKSIMEVRKVTVRSILQKIPRMVRDIASTCGKQVKVELKGEDIEVDKRLIETLDGPLTHMVRNSVDHGIETPDIRQESGKPPTGTVSVSVIETADDVTLSIKDDGKGLNVEAIKKKAVDLGLIDSGQELTQDQIIDMIFASGVSTAEKITEVSGRGVGMDVVKRNITAANGNISIDTKPGQGTEFRIQLPKTVSTQIITGFLVRFNHNRYVIPMDKVREVFRPEPQEISSIIGRGECVLRHGELLPVVKLGDVFGEANDSLNNGDAPIMVSISVGKRKVALYVDEVLSVQKVVLKELEALELESQIYAAAAVMGDGTVAMVLDIDHLFSDVNTDVVEA